MLGISGWHAFGLALYSVAITLLTSWLAARVWGRGQSTPIWSPWTIASNLLWSILLFLASIIAARYIQRLDSAVLGYALYATLGFLLSLLQARLQLRAGDRPAGSRSSWGALSSPGLTHSLTYLLLALILFLLVSWLTGALASAVLLVPLFVGALLPDLDAPNSLAGRLLPAISRPLASRIGPQKAWHTPAAAVVLALLIGPLSLLLHGSLAASLALFLGFAAHLLLDLLQPPGVMLLWPLSQKPFYIPGAALKLRRATGERRLLGILAVTALILLLIVGLGSAPPSAPVPAPSYDQTLARYRELRGRYLVFASVQGTWQTSGLRISGRFEVLGLTGDSYVLLDRYTRRIFTAGRSGQDHVYLQSIGLQPGSQVQIKPVEIQLKEQPLSAGLAVLYDMQREPGLVHIYAFGDLVTITDPAGGLPELPLEHSLTSLPRIEAEQQSRHCRLQYLTAAELIALANTEVETADLLIVATYSSPPAGPTATPLPVMPGNLEAAP
jgi:inner membrane protein